MKYYVKVIVGFMLVIFGVNVLGFLLFIFFLGIDWFDMFGW